MSESGPRKDQTYFIRNRGQVLGPFSIDKLKSLRARGQFSRVHEISLDRQNWKPASALDEVIGPSRPARGDPLTNAAEAARVAAASEAHLEAGTPPGATWHFNIGGEQQGPVSTMELRGLISQGKLHDNDYVWKEGMSDWLTVSQVPELRPAPVQMPASVVQTPLHDDGIHHTSGLAVASLVMGIVGLVTPFFIFNLLATVFGAAALKAIGRSRVALGGRGMALTGLILGIIGLIFWAIFLMFWFGVLASIMTAAANR